MRMFEVRRGIAGFALWTSCLAVLGACGGEGGEASSKPRKPAKPSERAPLSDAFEVSIEALERHVEFLARAPRTRGSGQLRESRDYCAEQLRELGFRVERQDVDRGGGENVYGIREGARAPNEQVLISAHIDSVAGCNGADDNASGVAGMLEIARLLSRQSHERTLIAACWDLEELGLLGSSAYAQRARERGDDIRVSFVLEMIGYRTDQPNSQKLPVPAELESVFAAIFPEPYRLYTGDGRRGDFITVIADSPGAFNAAGATRFTGMLAEAGKGVELKTIVLELSTDLIAQLPDTERSDHAAFWRSGYSAIQITDTAELRNPHYHCGSGPDEPSTLDYEFAAQVSEATAVAVARALDD